MGDVSLSLYLPLAPPPPPHWAYAPDTAVAGHKTVSGSVPCEWLGTATLCVPHIHDTQEWSMHN